MLADVSAPVLASVVETVVDTVVDTVVSAVFVIVTDDCVVLLTEPPLLPELPLPSAEGPSLGHATSASPPGIRMRVRMFDSPLRCDAIDEAVVDRSVRHRVDGGHVEVAPRVPAVAEDALADVQHLAEVVHHASVPHQRGE